MSVLETLLAVQELDTAADQLRHLLDRLPEKATRREADAAVAAAAAERRTLADRAAALEAEIAAAEGGAADVDRHVERLNRQLKTVIAPREAEALQTELATLAGRRSDLDDAGLAALDALGEVEIAQAALDDREPDLVDAAAGAAAAQAAAEAAVASQLADLAARRAAAAADAPPALLATYESMRSQFGGVAISRLQGATCGGCHIDLSRSELEAVRAQPPDEPAHCPNCDRWLVR